jgi:hypothetical protein
VNAIFVLPSAARNYCTTNNSKPGCRLRKFLIACLVHAGGTGMRIAVMISPSVNAV